MHHIVFVASDYPTKARPYYGSVFVQRTVRAIARMGIKCSIISPVSYFDAGYEKLDPKISFDLSIKDNYIKILRPRYLSLSSKNIFFYNTAHLTQKSFERAVYGALPYLDDVPPTILYGHFLYQSGAAAVRIASKLRIPSCVAVGESSFWSVAPIGYKKAIKDFRDVDRVIAVSSVIKKMLIQELMIPKEQICVLPNGVDLSLFYPRNSKEMRKQFAFPIDKFIIAFNGSFTERKGPLRLLEAVSGIEDIGLIFIGEGSLPVKSENILFQGVLEPSVVPEMLSAADIFVLPTIAEGSCNAILEALACGLPVITSNGVFNDDIVDNDVAIRINPLDISDIRSSVLTLLRNPGVRQTMSQKALNRIKQYDINNRAKKIVRWIETSNKNDMSSFAYGGPQ